MKENHRKIIKSGISRKNLILGSLIATLVAITPYLFYMYENVPQEKVWETFLFKYTANNYQTAYLFMWVLTGKLIPLYILFLWFFTCKHWWYHTLLVPIAMYAYQIFDVINKDAAFVDTNQLIYLIPIMAVIIPSIYLIRARIFNKINESNKSMEELEEEFKISPKNFWDKISQYF
ncbi:hypothetical protein [Aestuariivivens sediminis]|uniref:hypothetical protein n=1 Tax=Aestuariivivens sediminis TaxID=2913557 RepID=UPI001F56060F|nr:hypothetical protein [Aestuariivivens sediminis]